MADFSTGAASDAELRSLRERLQATLQSRVEAFSEEASEDEFITLLGAVGALKRVAARLHEIDRSGDAQPEERRTLVRALHTLADEMAR